MKNIDIRLIVSDKGLKYKKLAAEMGISHEHLSRVMSKELKPNMRTRILNAINELISREMKPEASGE